MQYQNGNDEFYSKESIMSVLLTFIGFIIAVVVFIYFINTLDAGKRKIEAFANSANVNSMEFTGQEPASKPGQVKTIVNRNMAVRSLPDDLKNLIPHRKCPLCCSTLKKDEPLYANFMDLSGQKKVLIYGCPYCYKEDTAGKEAIRDAV